MLSRIWKFTQGYEAIAPTAPWVETAFNRYRRESPGSG